MRNASISLAVASLLQVSAAELSTLSFRHVRLFLTVREAHQVPGRQTSLQQHAHRRPFIPKREMLTVTDSSYTTAIDVVVYVDQYGDPVGTVTETIVYVPDTASVPVPPPTEVSTASAVGTSIVYEGTATSVLVTDTSIARASDSTPSLYSVSPLPSSTITGDTGASSSSLYGVTYSPYKGTGACKSASEIDGDFAVFDTDYGVIRLYGVDCHQVASVYAAAKKYGHKLFLGIFDIDSVASAVSTIADGVEDDWTIVDTISVGNELVNNGVKSSDQVIAAVKQARTALRAAGYQGPVVTVDTFVAAIDYPELCDESDYCAINIHPFFDPNTGAAQAGTFIVTQVERVRSMLSDPTKRVVVTETGWPWKGDANGAAVPSKDNQAMAILSIKSSFSSNPNDCILFTAFNDLWKQAAAGTFFAEQYWGMGGQFSASDSQMVQEYESV